MPIRAYRLSMVISVLCPIRLRPVASGGGGGRAHPVFGRSIIPTIVLCGPPPDFQIFWQPLPVGQSPNYILHVTWPDLKCKYCYLNHHTVHRSLKKVNLFFTSALYLRRLISFFIVSSKQYSIFTKSNWAKFNLIY
jgi:hypothetical protein